MATPLKISIALWYHCRPSDFGKGCGDNNFNAPAVQEALQDFVNAGLLRKSPAGCQQREYYTTEGMTIWVEALCNVRWPEQQWVIPSSVPEYDRGGAA